MVVALHSDCFKNEIAARLLNGSDCRLLLHVHCCDCQVVAHTEQNGEMGNPVFRDLCLGDLFCSLFFLHLCSAIFC
jgi:hypothetical protein